MKFILFKVCIFLFFEFLICLKLEKLLYLDTIFKINNNKTFQDPLSYITREKVMPFLEHVELNVNQTLDMKYKTAEFSNKMFIKLSNTYGYISLALFDEIIPNFNNTFSKGKIEEELSSFFPDFKDNTFQNIDAERFKKIWFYRALTIVVMEVEYMVPIYNKTGLIITTGNYDVNDLKINENDFQLIFKNIIQKGIKDKFSLLLNYKTMFQILKGNSTIGINIEHLEKFLSFLKDITYFVELSDLQKIFLKGDVDENGYISEDEFIYLLEDFIYNRLEEIYDADIKEGPLDEL